MVQYFQNNTTANGLSCVARNPSGFLKVLAITYIHLSWYQPRVSMWFQRNGKSEQFLETAYPRKGYYNPSATVFFHVSSPAHLELSFKFPVMSKTENWRIRSRKANDAHCTTSSLGLPEASRVSPCANPWRGRHRLHVQRAWRQRYLRSTPACHTPPN